jgi:hypothetical protein
MYSELAIKLWSPKHEFTRSKSLTKLALYLTIAFVLNSEAMSGGALYNPTLIGSSPPQKTSDEKRGITFHTSETYLEERMGLSRPPMKKVALCFTNQKYTPKNARGSK